MTNRPNDPRDLVGAIAEAFVTSMLTTHSEQASTATSGTSPAGASKTSRREQGTATSCLHDTPAGQVVRDMDALEQLMTGLGKLIAANTSTEKGSGTDRRDKGAGGKTWLDTALGQAKQQVRAGANGKAYHAPVDTIASDDELDARMAWLASETRVGFTGPDKQAYMDAIEEAFRDMELCVTVNAQKLDRLAAELGSYSSRTTYEALRDEVSAAVKRAVSRELDQLMTDYQAKAVEAVKEDDAFQTFVLQQLDEQVPMPDHALTHFVRDDTPDEVVPSLRAAFWKYQYERGMKRKAYWEQHRSELVDAFNRRAVQATVESSSPVKAKKPAAKPKAKKPADT